MSSPYNESSLKLNTVKQKIIQSLLQNNYDLLSLCFARIYSANAHGESSWLYSELEGGLCLCIDYSRKSARFIMFDLISLEITFESEFYKNFNVFYSSINDTFQCFEVQGGFIGFSIPDKNQAKQFLKSVTSLTDQIIAKRVKENRMINKNELKSYAAKNIILLKKKLNQEYYFKEQLAHEKKIEFDFLGIEKLFGLIEWDPDTKSFQVSGNTDEIEDLMSKVSSVKLSEKGGVKVSDRKAYAMEIYKNMLNSGKIEKLELSKKQGSNQDNNSKNINNTNKPQTEIKIKNETNNSKPTEAPKKTNDKIPIKSGEKPKPPPLPKKGGLQPPALPNKGGTKPPPLPKKGGLKPPPLPNKGGTKPPPLPNKGGIKAPQDMPNNLPTQTKQPQENSERLPEISNETNETPVIKEPPKKKEPPKMDMMTELRMRMNKRTEVQESGENEKSLSENKSQINNPETSLNNELNSQNNSNLKNNFKNQIINNVGKNQENSEKINIQIQQNLDNKVLINNNPKNPTLSIKTENISNNIDSINGK
jgi:hypothetical protein